MIVFKSGTKLNLFERNVYFVNDKFNLFVYYIFRINNDMCVQKEKERDIYNVKKYNLNH